MFFQKVNSISTDELKNKLEDKKSNHILLDVRESFEYADGHIPGAINFPLGSIQQFDGSKEADIYVICHSGMRSQKAYKILQKQGYNVTNVSGGMMAWNGSVKGGMN